LPSPSEDAGRPNGKVCCLRELGVRVRVKVKVGPSARA